MIYEFTDGTNTVTLGMTVAQYEAKKIGPDTILHDGKELKRIYGMSATAKAPVVKRQLVSESMGVHPDEIPQRMEECRKSGVPTEFTPDGQVLFNGLGHRRKYMKLYGYADKRAYV